MANFPKLKLTNAGLELLANVQAGADTLTFTKTALGDGKTTAAATDMTALVSKKIDAAITEGKQVGVSTYQIGAFFSNAEVTTGFWWREVGVYAKGNDGNEILYCYSNAGDAGDFIPVGSDERVEKYIYLSFSIGNAENVTLEVDGSDIFVLKKDFTAHKDASNPHGITAETIHLENVPNVATNDQTPTYTEAATLETLTSGEKMSVAFGKIKKAIATLISHLADATKHITSAERTTWNSKAPGEHGLGEYAEGFQAKSYHDIMRNGGGFYQIAYEEDSPHSVEEWIGLLQLVRQTAADKETGAQLAFRDANPEKPRMWLRTLYDGVSGSWVEIFHTGNISNFRATTLNVPVSNSWTSNTSGGYKQTINVSGILATDNPVVDIVLGDDVEANKSYIKAWECISYITTANGSITLYADKKPEVAFTIKLKVV